MAFSFAPQIYEFCRAASPFLSFRYGCEFLGENLRRTLCAREGAGVGEGHPSKLRDEAGGGSQFHCTHEWYDPADHAYPHPMLPIQPARSCVICGGVRTSAVSICVHGMSSISFTFQCVSLPNSMLVTNSNHTREYNYKFSEILSPYQMLFRKSFHKIRWTNHFAGFTFGASNQFRFDANEEKTMTLVIERNFFRRGENGGDISNVRLECDLRSMFLDGKELPDSSVEYLLTFALQSLQDAYAGAKNLSEAKGMFGAKYDKLINGTIGVRSAGETVSDEIRIGRKLMRAALKTNKANWEKFISLDEEKQVAKLDELLEKNAAAMAPKIAAEIKRLADEKKAKALLGKELSFEL